jgi:integrase
MAKKRKMGGVKPIHIEKLNLWYANIGEVVNGRAKRVYAPKSVDSEKAAWKWLEDRQAEQAARQVDRADPDVLGLANLYLDWSRERSEAGHITRKEYVNRRTHLLLLTETQVGGRSFAKMKARQFTSTELGSLVEVFQGDGYSPQYIANVVRTAKGCFKWASDRVAGRVPARILEENDVKDYSPPAVPRPPDRYVESEVIRRFLRWAWAKARRSPGHSKRFDRLYLLLFRFCYLTGARPGEACRLTWPMVHWKDQVVIIPPSEHKTGKKTGKPREIQITTPVARLLRAIERLEGRHPSHVFTHRRGKGGGNPDGSAQAGDPWTNAEAAGKHMAKLRLLAIEAGVEGLVATGPKKLVQYTNRHVYASDALMDGMTSSEAAELLGNSAAMVESRYGHIQRSHTRRRAEEMVRRGRG